VFRRFGTCFVDADLSAEPGTVSRVIPSVGQNHSLGNCDNEISTSVQATIAVRWCSSPTKHPAPSSLNSHGVTLRAERQDAQHHMPAGLGAAVSLLARPHSLRLHSRARPRSLRSFSPHFSQPCRQDRANPMPAGRNPGLPSSADRMQTRACRRCDRYAAGSHIRPCRSQPQKWISRPPTSERRRLNQRNTIDQDHAAFASAHSSSPQRSLSGSSFTKEKDSR
jgi:hypothetical protein